LSNTCLHTHGNIKFEVNTKIKKQDITNTISRLFIVVGLESKIDMSFISVNIGLVH